MKAIFNFIQVFLALFLALLVTAAPYNEDEHATYNLAIRMSTLHILCGFQELKHHRRRQCHYCQY